MEEYNKIIESLGIHFVGISKRHLIQPIKVAGFHDMSNTICLLEKGSLSYGSDSEHLNAHDILFIPAGKLADVTYGSDGEVINHEKFTNNLDKFFRTTMSNEPSSEDNSYVHLTFEAKLFDAVSYFSSLDIPPFVIPENKAIAALLHSIIVENSEERPGKERIIRLYTEQIVIEIIRHILSNQLFVEQLATNTTYFKDPRLIDIFKFIKENLSGDLSNKVLANVANVSEDYVGQYFKMLTGINPQDYIEYQRMESAVYLLRTTKKSIRAIGKEVGYKDTAYFCRRFKMMFGIPAGKLRRRESMM